MTRAIMLCAGFGTRLGGIGAGCPKPLLPVCGVPIVKFGIAKLVAHGIVDIVINLHHKAERFQKELGTGEELGARISYSVEDKILGTGGGLKKALSLLDPEGSNEPFLSMNGKLIFDIDLTKVVEAFKQQDALGMMVVRPSPEAQKWGAVDVSEDAQRTVKNILGSGGYMFGGVHVTRPSTIRKLPDGEACMVRQGYLPWIKEGKTVAAFVDDSDGYFAEHSTPRRYLESNLALLKRNLANPPDFQIGIHPTARVSSEATVTPPVLIGAGATIEDGAQVGPDVVIGRGATIAKNTRVSQSVIWANTRLERSGKGLISTSSEVTQTEPE